MLGLVSGPYQRARLRFKGLGQHFASEVRCRDEWNFCPALLRSRHSLSSILHLAVSPQHDHVETYPSTDALQRPTSKKEKIFKGMEASIGRIHDIPCYEPELLSKGAGRPKLDSPSPPEKGLSRSGSRHARLASKRCG